MFITFWYNIFIQLKKKKKSGKPLKYFSTLRQICG